MTTAEFRAALAELGISQQGWARLWGLNPRTVRRWALGEAEVPPWAALAVRLLLAVPAARRWVVRERRL